MCLLLTSSINGNWSPWTVDEEEKGLGSELLALLTPSLNTCIESCPCPTPRLRLQCLSSGMTWAKGPAWGPLVHPVQPSVVPSLGPRVLASHLWEG
jgi:hypothetical protein